MNIIGRYEKIRIWYPYNNKISIPYIIDKKQNILSPAQDRNWWKSPDGIWLPIPAGGVGNTFVGGAGSGIILGPTELDGLSLTFGTHILDSAYTAGSGGDAVGFRFIVTENKTLTDIYFSVENYLGTAGNVNDINIEIWDESSSATLPDVGGSVIDTATVDPSSVSDQWIAVSGLSASLTAGNAYWCVIGDADGNTTDRARLKVDAVGDNSGQLPWSSVITAWQTTNGWSSAAYQSDIPTCVLSFNDSTSIGFPFLVTGSAASDTNQKGILLNNGFTGNARIYGVVLNDADNDLSSLKIWEGSDGPSTGSPFASTSVFVRSSVTSGTLIGGFIFTDTLPLLAAGTTYRIVFQPGASAVDAPDTYETGATSDANIRAAFPGGGDWYSTVESGGSWSNDQDAFPLMGIMINDFESSGGGGEEASSGRSFPTLP